MSVSRRRPRRRVARLGVSVLAFALLPNQIGFQDLGALIARQPAVAQRWRQHIAVSPFGTIHAAMFSLPRPIGTAIPPPPLYALASVDPNEITGSLGRDPLGDPAAPMQFPSVNRKKKGDALAARPREPLPPLPPMAALPAEAALPPADAGAPVDDSPAPEQDAANARFGRYNDYEIPTPADKRSQTPDVDLPYVDLPPTDLTKLAPGSDEPGGTARLYFGINPMSALQEAIAPWAPGEAPMVMAPPAPGDPDIKLSALTPPEQAAAAAKPGETIAGKGQVTGEDKRPMSPAARLKLTGIARAKAEKCLANAVYFEARGEAVRGQIAVAQVVMNRVFSPFYPNDVCGVVYQNAHRHLACQFTFACDGIPDVVTEPDQWVRAKRIAADMLDGKLWMPEVAKSTHYHAYWVRPSWVNEMKKLYKFGVHTFYRPRAWGDGADEPKWGDAKATAEATEKL